MILDNYINSVRSDVTEIKVKTNDDTELALHIKPMSEADWQVAQAYFVSGVADLAGRAFPFAIEKSLCKADGSQVREDGKTALITQKQAANLKPVVLWGLWSEIKKLHDDPKP